MSSIVMNKMKRLVFLCLALALLGCLEDTSRMMVDGKLEPPAPNSSENDKTIGGIDSNEDGVRDDIERWINREFSGDENYNKRMAWKQYSKEIRNIQLSVGDEEKLNKHSYLWNDADVCTYYIYSTLNKEGLKESFKIDKKILEKSNNTEERIKAWLVADRSFAGKAYADPSYSQRYEKCDFKVRK